MIPDEGRAFPGAIFRSSRQPPIRAQPSRQIVRGFGKFVKSTRRLESGICQHDQPRVDSRHRRPVWRSVEFCILNVRELDTITWYP